MTRAQQGLFGGWKEHGSIWFTPAEAVIELIDKIVNIPKSKVIWCPFDTAESEFVKVLTSKGYKVIHSHIDDNQDFFTYEPKEHWDIIMSNPPFEKKRLIIERCMSFKKPFILLMGSTVSIQSGQLAHDLNQLSMFHCTKQYTFHNPEGKTIKLRVLWLMTNDIIWKESAYEL